MSNKPEDKMPVTLKTVFQGVMDSLIRYFFGNYLPKDWQAGPKKEKPSQGPAP